MSASYIIEYPEYLFVVNGILSKIIFSDGINYQKEKKVKMISRDRIILYYYKTTFSSFVKIDPFIHTKTRWGLGGGFLIFSYDLPITNRAITLMKILVAFSERGGLLKQTNDL